jgi:hypothetical protein
VRPEDIIARLKALRDPRMRVLAVIEALHGGDPSLWAHVLASIVTRAHRGDDPDASEALEAVTHAAADPSLAYETRKRLYEAALRERLAAIARLFLIASPATTPQAAVAKSLAPERPLKPTGRPLTLGERKSLARTHDREQLQLLLRDPHPAVVAILLDNPHMTETDIVRLASARPAMPASLALVAAHAKWSAHHPVKRALVMNPATPLADAIRIATTLRSQELHELTTDPALREPLRAHAADVLAAMRNRPQA